MWGPLIAALGRDDAVSLSPPGFGVPASSEFSATVEGYREWLTARLEQIREPVDLVGHDWGGAHVVQIAMTRPDLIRSWASDALGLFAPDYVWHARAQVWQQKGAGEGSAKEIFGGTLAPRLEVVGALGMTGPAAERVAAGMDDGQVPRKRLRWAGPGGAPDALNDLDPHAGGAIAFRWPAGRHPPRRSPGVWGAASAPTTWFVAAFIEIDLRRIFCLTKSDEKTC